MRPSMGRWLLSVFVGYVATSGLNWWVAEKLLNPVIKPGFGALMRTGASTQVGVIVAGFALLVIVLGAFVALLRVPEPWWARGLVAGGLMSLTLFGAYTFISGWLALPTREMCLTATADSATLLVGALVMAWLQKPRPA